MSCEVTHAGRLQGSGSRTGRSIVVLELGEGERGGGVQREQRLCWEDGNVLEVDGGDSGITVYRVALNATLESG